MKALVYTGPKQINYETDWPDVTDQALGAVDGDIHDSGAHISEAVVAIEAVGICGSDMHAWLGHDERRPPPLILGHEAAGTVVRGANVGQRVTINPLVSCGECAACRSGQANICPKRQLLSMPPRQGCFATYVRVPERNLVPIPDNLESAQACLVEPIACSYHAVTKAAALHRLPTCAALVIGGGGIGLTAALCLRAFGAAQIQIAERNADRRAYIYDKEHFETFDPAEHSPVDGFDVVIDAYGGDASRDYACRVLRPGGSLVHIGLAGGDSGLDIRRMTLQEINFLGCYTYTAQEFVEAADLVSFGTLGALDWVEHRAMSEGATAFQDLHSGRVAAPKIVLHTAN